MPKWIELDELIHLTHYELHTYSFNPPKILGRLAR